MKKTYLLSIALCCSIGVQTAQSQGFTAGISATTPLGNPSAFSVSQFITISATEKVENLRLNDGLGISIFGRYDFKKVVVLADVQQSKLRASYYINTPQNGWGAYNNNKQLLGSISAGYKPLPWLRVSSGMGVSHLTGNFFSESTLQDIERLKAIEPKSNHVTNYLRMYKIQEEVNTNINKNHLIGKVGIGADFSGFQLDFYYKRSLTPYLESTANKLHYGGWNLALGYRLLPVNEFLTATKKNKVVAKEKAAIPFYRNEVNILLGKELEDFNSLNVYENTFTHYWLPRVGTTVGISTMSPVLMAKSRSDKVVTTERSFSLFTEMKCQLLYTQRHRIGIAAGLNLTKRSGLHTSSGGTYYDVQGNIIAESYGIESVNKGWRGGYQLTADYNFLLTPHLPIGIFLRVNGEDFPTIDSSFGQFGLKSGYKF